MPRITEARATAQRARILDAALACFARQGFHAATMQDIITESGLSPGAIYGYFKGKTEIVAAIAAARHAAERERMQQALAASDIDGMIDGLVNDFIVGLQDPQEKQWRRLAVQLWAESLADSRLKREAMLGVERAVAALSELVRKAQREGRWPAELDPQAAARVMVATLQGLALQQAWDDRIDISAAAQALRTLIARRPK